MTRSKSDSAPEPVMVDHLVIIDGHDHHILASDKDDLDKKIATIRAAS
jgi:hypothetical protein